MGQARRRAVLCVSTPAPACACSIERGYFLRPAVRRAPPFFAAFLPPLLPAPFPAPPFFFAPFRDPPPPAPLRLLPLAALLDPPLFRAPDDLRARAPPLLRPELPPPSPS